MFAIRKFAHSASIYFYFMISIALAAPAALANDDGPKKVPQSVTAKLYWAAKLMDDHDNWREVSELLREVLKADLDNDFVRARVKKVKQYVDREPARRAKRNLADSRLDTHSFLEARILLVECLMELRPRLNLSWTGEVRHLKQMLFSAIFPHAEEQGEIVFPEPRTYSFDYYGYTIRNLKALMIAPGGKELEPLFNEFVTASKLHVTKAPGKEDTGAGSTMFFERLSNFRNRIHSTLLKEGINPDSITTGSWDPTFTGDLLDNIRFSKKTDGDVKASALSRVYAFVTDVLTAMRNHRSIDEYEPLTLLWVAVANPELIDHDPQLKAFISGVKFRLRVASAGSDDSGFRPRDYELVRLVNDSLVPGSKVKLEFEVDSQTGRSVLYVVSNFNGDTNIAFNVLSFRNVVTFLQAAKFMPESAVSWIKATPQHLEKVANGINEWLKTSAKADNIIYRFMGPPARVLFDVTMVLGKNTLVRGAKSLSVLVKKVAARPSMQKAFYHIKSDRFLRILVGLSVASDVTTGVIEYLYAADDSQRPDIVIHSGSQAAGTLLYLAKRRALILGVAGLDIGHMVFDKIPSTSQIIEKVAHYGYGKYVKLTTGHSRRELELENLKQQLGIEDGQAEALELLTEYQRSIQQAVELDDLKKAKATLSERIGMFAARRLVFHYVTVTGLNGGGEGTLGHELRDQNEQYNRLMYWTWFNPPGGKLQEQPGLPLLDKLYQKKWKQLGGDLPTLANP